MLATPQAANPLQFRQALGRLAAGTTIVTLMDAQGVRMGFTATSVSSVSLEPPLVLVCINNKSRTIAPLAAGARFVLNFMAAEQQALAMQFASQMPDKFAGVATHISAGGGIHLSDALAGVECLPQHLYSAGDHQIVVGLVVDTVIGSDRQPLVYFRSQFL